MEIINIVKTEIRVDRSKPTGNWAEVVMIDEKGTEYRVEGKIYTHGEYQQVETTITAKTVTVE